VLGIPAKLTEKYRDLYIYESDNQVKFDFVREVLEAKSADLGDDVLSDLLSSELTPSEIEGLTFTLLISGRDSVAYTIVTSVVALLSNPEQLEALREDPDLMSSAIEEFMRFGSMFVTLFPRTALEDVQFGDVFISQGQTVSVSQVAANRDPGRFEAPDQFDLSRDAFGHIGFGHGIHGCVGQQLARIEIRTAVSRIINSLPGLHLVEADQLEPRPFANPVATYEAGRVIVGWES
jgi:cytochrome P450